MFQNFHNRTLFRSKSAKSSLLLPLFVVLFSCASDPNKRPSPLRVEKAMIGGVSVELTYSSPAVRERQIFGKGKEYLEQYGELWRTGANKATTIFIDSPLLVDSIELDSGMYSIFTIPEETEWTLIINENWDQWGSYNYKESQDVLRLQLQAKKLSDVKERMRLFVENDSLKFQWDQTEWAVQLANPL